MANRVLLGMLTPSSNTILEPVTSAILADLPEVSAHFGRLRVTEISMNETSVDQFKDTSFLNAASLLADARVDCMAWNGTAAGWLGFETDRKLCRAIAEATGVPATTSVLAMNEILERTGIERFALVTPYLDEIQERIIENYAGAGYACVAERHLRDRGNFSFSLVPDREIAELVRAVAAERPEAIMIFCTNFLGATVVDELERELDIPIYDTVAVTAWKCLSMAGVDTARVTGWGRLFGALN